MSPVSTLLLVLATTPLVVANDDRQPSVGHTFFLSHLSPLFTYTPLTPTDDPVLAWNTSLDLHRTTNPDASVQFSYFGTGYNIWGNSSLDASGRYRTDLDWHEATIKTNGSDGSFMDIGNFMLRTVVPAVSLEKGTAEHISAVDDPTNFYRDEAGAWEVMEPPVNQSTGIQFSWAWDEPPSYTVDYPFNSTVLSTDQVGQPLRFSVPPYTSIMQWYGTVGPDQGRYQLRLIPTSEGNIQFQPHPLNQSHTAERPIDSILEMKAIAWLDPRATYDVEIELQEEGKRTDIHGVSFWRYTEVGAEIQDWWSEPSSGLSGGQIAGIVVGSVAGAALIGLGIWWFLRRRNRQRSGSVGNHKISDDA